jgi:hypothetical protein
MIPLNSATEEVTFMFDGYMNFVQRDLKLPNTSETRTCSVFDQCCGLDHFTASNM